MDCCAEISGRYFHLFEVANNSSHYYSCAPWMFSQVCPRMNAFKQQCDAMQCPQNCVLGYACTSYGYESLVRSIPDNTYHPAETDACVQSGRKWITP
jgi:hypothetical protein